MSEETIRGLETERDKMLALIGEQPWISIIHYSRYEIGIRFLKFKRKRGWQVGTRPHKAKAYMKLVEDFYNELIEQKQNEYNHYMI